MINHFQLESNRVGSVSPHSVTTERTYTNTLQRAIATLAWILLRLCALILHIIHQRWHPFVVRYHHQGLKGADNITAPTFKGVIITCGKKISYFCWEMWEECQNYASVRITRVNMVYRHIIIKACFFVFFYLHMCGRTAHFSLGLFHSKMPQSER